MFLLKKIILILIALVLTGAGCGGPSSAQQAASKRVSLTVWGVFDDQDSLQGIMNAYQQAHPNVSVSYRKLRIGEYEDALLRAFAEGNGPDVFFVHNTWLPEYRSLITPLPESLTIPYDEVRGTIKKETITVLREEKTITPAELAREFIDVVPADVVMSYRATQNDNYENRIFGLPLGVDTLGLFYNKDLFNAAGIAEPPQTWQEFQAQVKKLTLVGKNDEILQSGAALGTGKNVERAFDILSLLMLQNQTQMIDTRGAASFALQNKSGGRPGLLATQFYTDFANPSKAVYTWNQDQPNSFEAFVTGKTAFFFGYSYHLPAINARAEKLRFDVTSMPQISGAPVVNYANYWVQTVSKSSPDRTWAWDFVQFAASAQQVPKYLREAGRPTARRSLIAEQSTIPELKPFVEQLLTAKSWYQGNNAQAAEAALLELIDGIHEGRQTPEAAINDAQTKVNLSL